MKRTKKLTIEEYGSSKVFNKKQEILNLVRKEDLDRWAKTENTALLYKAKPIKLMPLTAGMKNLILQLLP